MINNHPFEDIQLVFEPSVSKNGDDVFSSGNVKKPENVVF
jgi:hypothetical protein